MNRWTRYVSLIALMQGCATQLHIAAESGPDDPQTASAHRVLRFQHSFIEPSSADALLMPDDLRPGDIILTSTQTLDSAGIQLLTFAPVSHAAIYIGDHQVVEAVVSSGVRIRRLDELLAEKAAVLAFRYLELNEEQARSIRVYALQQVGTQYNYLGVALHVPFALTRRLCELPLVPSVPRDACIRIIGAIHHLPTSERRFFCSQLVLQAYRHARVPITNADPRLITPADILHMREGDVSSVRIKKRLHHLGHLKHQPAMVALQR